MYLFVALILLESWTKSISGFSFLQIPPAANNGSNLFVLIFTALTFGRALNGLGITYSLLKNMELFLSRSLEVVEVVGPFQLVTSRISLVIFSIVSRGFKDGASSLHLRICQATYPLAGSTYIKAYYTRFRFD